VTLRARLVLALLASALVPTLVFSLFTLDLLNEGVSRWYSPQVEGALSSAREVTLTALTRLEATVLAQSRRWASEWPAVGARPERRAAIAASLRMAGVDFLQIYRRGAAGWSRADEIDRDDVLLMDRRDVAAQLPATLDAPQLLRSPSGALASAAPLAGGDALVVGMWVPQDFFTDVDRLQRGITYYPRLDVVARLWRGYLGFVVAGVVIALILMATLLARALALEMSRPLSALSQAIERVAAGDLRTRVEPRGALEVRSLALSFNSMTGRLESARDAVQQAEREAAWRDVARKLAHEFKNLLTPMQLSLQLLECQVESVPAEERKAMTQNLAAAMRELGHLRRLAAQFSQYARLPEPQLERVDLTEVARAAAALEPAAAIQVTASPVALPVRGDRLLLSRAIHNLLLNACEASPAGVPVELRTEIAGTRARVEILDRGPGLPAGLRGRLFEPYVSTKKRGSGLGLSLVRDIALQHQGEVTLDDRPGGGVRAVFSLPLVDGPQGSEAA
jgi:nitrogen fixation/metabolism regulation signal transduction histidine kinase